jgi:hypothetical protein
VHLCDTLSREGFVPSEIGMVLASAAALPRRSLDQLVSEMVQPGFVARHGRGLQAPHGGGHVDAAVLALSRAGSRYVRRWRRHARRCPGCRQVFRSLGLSLR